MSEPKVGAIHLKRIGAQVIVYECIKARGELLGPQWSQIGSIPVIQSPDVGVIVCGVGSEGLP